MLVQYRLAMSKVQYNEMMILKVCLSSANKSSVPTALLEKE